MENSSSACHENFQLELMIDVKLTKNLLCFIVSFILSLPVFKTAAQAKHNNPLRLAVAGITHGHVGWILGRKDKTDIIIAGIYERDTSLSKRYAKQYNLEAGRFYINLNKMLDAVKPEAVVAFGSI